MKWILLCLLLITLIPGSTQEIVAKTLNHPPNWRQSLETPSNEALINEMIALEEQNNAQVKVCKLHIAMGELQGAGGTTNTRLIAEMLKKKKQPIRNYCGFGQSVEPNKLVTPFGPGHLVYDKLLKRYKSNQLARLPCN